MTGAAAAAWRLPDRGRVGIGALLVAESAVFAILVAAYVFYVGQSRSGPTPRDLLVPPVAATACLLASSLTIARAVAVLRAGRAGFAAWWAVTLGLGVVFLAATAAEWARLLGRHGFTIRTNLFGTTYYALVGLHGCHVAAGVLALAVVLALAWRGRVRPSHARHVDVLAIYWHFVDAVWVVVFGVVYVAGR